MKIVIGTRRWLGPEWTHVDIDPQPLWEQPDPNNAEHLIWHPVDLVADAKDVPLPDGCADHVYTQECLEHFSWREYKPVLAEWCRLVKPGGTIRIEVPDFLSACQQVLGTDTEDMDRRIQQIIFGGQENQWDFHYVGHTHRTLPADIEANGFTINSVARGHEVGYLRVDATKNLEA